MITPAGAPSLSLAEATLAVIDMQVAFRDKHSDWGIPRYAEVAARIALLAERFRERVLWTKFIRDPLEAGVWSDYYDRWSAFRVDSDSALWDLTLTPEPGQPIISSSNFSKWGPDLASHVPLGAPLLLCGVATDCCVLATALGAVDAGRSVVLVTDACAAIDDDAQQQTLRLLSLLAPMVTLTTTAAVLEGG